MSQREIWRAGAREIASVLLVSAGPILVATALQSLVAFLARARDVDQVDQVDVDPGEVDITCARAGAEDVDQVVGQ